jgi:hypothetical protein
VASDNGDSGWAVLKAFSPIYWYLDEVWGRHSQLEARWGVTPQLPLLFSVHGGLSMAGLF